MNPNLLFVGTEFGMSFTVDGGAHWVKIKGGMPTITIRDLTIQRRESDLVAASFGRGFFVLDDFSALRKLTPQTLAQEGTLFPVGRPARALRRDRILRARRAITWPTPNPPFGALLTYYLRDNAQGDAKIVLTVTDSAGKQVRQIDASGQAGIASDAVGSARTAPAAPAGAQGGGRRGGGGGMPPAAMRHRAPESGQPRRSRRDAAAAAGAARVVAADAAGAAGRW